MRNVTKKEMVETILKVVFYRKRGMSVKKRVTEETLNSKSKRELLKLYQSSRLVLNPFAD